MSSYLNFYLVPKKSEQPLHFLSYSKNSDIYQQFNKILNPVFVGIEECNYQELTYNDVLKVRNSVYQDIENAKKTLDKVCEAFNSIENPSIKFMNQHTNDYISRMEYIDELKDTKDEINGILNWIGDIEYSDFKKVLINIDY